MNVKSFAATFLVLVLVPGTGAFAQEAYSSSCTCSEEGWTPPPCPYAGTPDRGLPPGVCHPYPQPRPQASVQETECDGRSCFTKVTTGEGIWPCCDPFNYATYPGNNLLPTIYTNAFDFAGREMENTLPSTPDVPYNLHDGDPVVTVINALSPADDLKEIFDDLIRWSLEIVAREKAESTDFDRSEIEFLEGEIPKRIRTGIDILEGNEVPNRAYSGLPLLHYKGPEKLKKVEPIRDGDGRVVGGNVDVHQVWYGGRIESDTAFFDVSAVLDVPWTVTYYVDVLNRGHDDFSPFVMFWDRLFTDPEAKPHVGMDQTFFDMEEGTRTVFVIKMPPGRYYNLVYTWGWRMHPPRIQVIENGGKKVKYSASGQNVACPASYEGLSLPEIEAAVFGEDPSSSPEAKLAAIAKIGEMAPAKRMWTALRNALLAAGEHDYRRLAEIVEQEAQPAFFAWDDRTHVPCFRFDEAGRCLDGFEPDPEADVTIVYMNNTLYGEITSRKETTRGLWVQWDDWKRRPATLKVTAYNADHYVHAYTVADFGGNRGWENQFKSSVRVAGSGCWFTFGRVHWWMAAGSPADYLCVPAVDGGEPGVHRFEIEFHYEPSRRLRFYQFDPFHHDVAIFSVH